MQEELPMQHCAAPDSVSYSLRWVPARGWLIVRSFRLSGTNDWHNVRYVDLSSEEAVTVLSADLEAVIVDHAYHASEGDVCG